jgi:ABC-type sugar transport system ATPase subunit
MVQIEATTLADRILVMNHGRIEQVGKPLELYYAPAPVCRWIHWLPAMNFFPAEVESIEDGTARIAGDSVAHSVSPPACSSPAQPSPRSAPRSRNAPPRATS